MALLSSLGSVVRLPLHAAVTVLSTARALLPGAAKKAAPLPTDAAPAPVPTPAKKASAKKAPAATIAEPVTTAPVPDPAAPAGPAKKAASAKKTAPAKKATPTKKPAASKAPTPDPAAPPAAPGKKADPKVAATLPPPVQLPEQPSEPVTEIDAAAASETVSVTPADIAGAMGKDLEDPAPTS